MGKASTSERSAKIKQAGKEERGKRTEPSFAAIDSAAILFRQGDLSLQLSLTLIPPKALLLF